MKIPKSKKDILVKNYLKYIEYIKTEPQEEKEILKETVKIFYELDEENFNKFEYSVLLDMYKIIENILSLAQPLVATFTFENIEYGINPDFDDMTFGEMVDCDTTDVMQQICILYRPIVKKKGNKYTIEKYNADISTYDELKEILTLDIYLGFVGFFLKINQDLLNYTLQYIKEMDIQVKKKKSSQKHTDGTVGFMTYVLGTLQKWIPSWTKK